VQDAQAGAGVVQRPCGSPAPSRAATCSARSSAASRPVTTTSRVSSPRRVARAVASETESRTCSPERCALATTRSSWWRANRIEFLAGGRPVVAVHDEYDTTTAALNLVVENVGQGPAKDVNFEFSRPIESSDGVVLSGLPLFTVGLTSLSPAAKITCYWDDFADLRGYLRGQGREGYDFEVTVGYSDLTGAVYSNRWDIQPGIYEGLRSHPSQQKPGRARGDYDTAGRPDTEAEHDTEPSTAAGPMARVRGTGQRRGRLLTRGRLLLSFRRSSPACGSPAYGSPARGSRARGDY